MDVTTTKDDEAMAVRLQDRVVDQTISQRASPDRTSRLRSDPGKQRKLKKAKKKIPSEQAPNLSAVVNSKPEVKAQAKAEAHLRELRHSQHKEQKMLQKRRLMPATTCSKTSMGMDSETEGRTKPKKTNVNASQWKTPFGSSRGLEPAQLLKYERWATDADGNTKFVVETIPSPKKKSRKPKIKLSAHGSAMSEEILSSKLSKSKHSHPQRNSSSLQTSGSESDELLRSSKSSKKKPTLSKKSALTADPSGETSALNDVGDDHHRNLPSTPTAPDLASDEANLKRRSSKIKVTPELTKKKGKTKNDNMQPDDEIIQNLKIDDAGGGDSASREQVGSNEDEESEFTIPLDGEERKVFVSPTHGVRRQESLDQITTDESRNARGDDEAESESEWEEPSESDMGDADDDSFDQDVNIQQPQQLVLEFALANEDGVEPEQSTEFPVVVLSHDEMSSVGSYPSIVSNDSYDTKMNKMMQRWVDTHQDDFLDEVQDHQSFFEGEVYLEDNVLDHIVLAAPDLEEAMLQFEELTGIKPTLVGPLQGLGAKTAHIGLDNSRYIELLGPDKRNPGALGDDLLALEKGTLTPYHYAIRSSEVTNLVEGYVTDVLGWDPDRIAMVQQLPDSSCRQWDLLAIYGHGLGGVSPYYVKWNNAQTHPTNTIALDAKLKSCLVRAPADHDVHKLITDVDGIRVEQGEPVLEVSFETPKGIFTFSCSTPKGLVFPGFGGQYPPGNYDIPELLPMGMEYESSKAEKGSGK